jgi:hypothetical protein
MFYFFMLHTLLVVKEKQSRFKERLKTKRKGEQKDAKQWSKNK